MSNAHQTASQTSPRDVRVRDHWLLDRALAFLNHGSFGACPRPVLDAQTALRGRMERDPVAFLAWELEALLDEARASVADFVGCAPDDLVFVPNATFGINMVLRSLSFGAGDDLLTTDHEYNASLNALRLAAGAGGARVVVAHVPFPLRSPEEVLDAVLGAVTPRTRLALISHVTSATALVFPIRRLVAELRGRGVETLVDGAHAPGMVSLDLRAVDPAFYTGNGHKWLCGPKGSGFLYVRPDLQARVRPLAVSHGANSPRRDRSRFLLEADWTGTPDPTACLALPTAIRFLGDLVDGGWPELMARNHALALEARGGICSALAVDPPAPAEMIGSMAAVPLPPGIQPPPHASDPTPVPGDTLPDDPLHDVLLERFGIQVPVHAWPRAFEPGRSPLRLLRVSAFIYNERAEYARLADALVRLRGHASPRRARRPHRR